MKTLSKSDVSGYLFLEEYLNNDTLNIAFDHIFLYKKKKDNFNIGNNINLHYFTNFLLKDGNPLKFDLHKYINENPDNGNILYLQLKFKNRIKNSKFSLIVFNNDNNNEYNSHVRVISMDDISLISQYKIEGGFHKGKSLKDLNNHSLKKLVEYRKKNWKSFFSKQSMIEDYFNKNYKYYIKGLYIRDFNSIKDFSKYYDELKNEYSFDYNMIEKMFQSLSNKEGDIVI